MEEYRVGSPCDTDNDGSVLAPRDGKTANRVARDEKKGSNL